VNGVPLRVLPGHRGYFAPDYDAPVAAFFRARVRPGDVCISVGANIGVYPLQFANWAAPGGRVFAFEPNPKTAEVLRAHVRINGLEDRIHVLQNAVADRTGTATFHAAGLDGMSRLGEPNPRVADKTVPITVEVETLDVFCDREQVRPNAMMIDVEGFEVAVLAGARSLFANARCLVTVVEMHPNAWPVAGSDRSAFENLLADLHVRVVPLSGQSDPLGEYGHVYLEPLNG
jgi:FkbM family methyltransferase